MLGINTILCLGIIAATAGLIFWLADAVAVVVCGMLFLAVGVAILVRGAEHFRMFGTAAVLIGAGMLIGGAAVELIKKHEAIAGWSMTIAGAGIALVAGWLFFSMKPTFRFVVGSILLMGLALHLGGFGYLLYRQEYSGLLTSVYYLYAFVVMATAGVLTNVRLVTALSIVPFAQILDTGTFYFHAMYAFVSPEPTLSIIQMALLIGVCVWLAARVDVRTARHLLILAIMAFVVANLCALVGSLFGDVVGQSVWGPGLYTYQSKLPYEEFEAAVALFREHALVLPAGLYSVLWAIALAAIVAWAAHRNQRGLFNAALVFGGIHAYTQLFESFADEPLAYVIGGLAAIPLAWGMWRFNQWMVQRANQSPAMA